MDNKKENIIENEIEVQVKEDNGAVLEYARRLAKFSDGKGDKMDDGKHIKTIAYDRIYSLEVDYEATNR